MGIHYFNCDYCNEVASEYCQGRLKIKALGELTICDDCYNYLKGHVSINIDNENDKNKLNTHSYFVRHNDTNIVTFLTSFEELNNFKNVMYGCYYDNIIPDIIKSGLNGVGHTLENIKQLLMDENCTEISIGWQKKSNIIKLNKNDENILDSIKKYINEHYLNFVPFCAIPNFNVDPNILDTFCILDTNKSDDLISWSDSILGLVKKINGSFDEDEVDITLIPDQELVKMELDSLELQIKKLTKKQGKLLSLLNK